MKDRILKIMEHEGMSPSRFAEEIGIQRSAMSHIISGRNNASLDVLTKIMQRFTYVETDWLLFGKGNMIKSASSIIGQSSLFLENEIDPPTVQVEPEYRKQNEVNRPETTSKNTIIEQIKYEERCSKNVSKIMVFIQTIHLKHLRRKKTRKTNNSIALIQLYRLSLHSNR